MTQTTDSQWPCWERRAYRKSDGDNWRTGSLHQRDPNAMEIDAKKNDSRKRTFLMKQKLCFKCEGQGHLARDCKGKKKDIKDIHALLTALTAKEKRELLSLPNTSLTEEKDEDF